MAKTKTISKRTQLGKLYGDRLFKRCLGGLIAIAVVAQLGFDYGIYNHVIRNGGDQTTIVSLISQAVDGVNKPAVVDPLTDKIYFPDARLVLSLQAAPLDQLVYSYSPALGGVPASIQVTTHQAVQILKARLWDASSTTSAWASHNPDKTFAAVPALQACARGVHGIFNATKHDAIDGKLLASLHLQDGRILSWYLTQPNLCPINLQPLADYLESAASY